MRLLLGGVKSLLPWRPSYTMSPQPVDALYGYSVWLRHVTVLAERGFRGPFGTVAELGPGNSVATGISAVLSGTDHYIGLDVIRHVAHRSGRTVLERLESLFAEHAPIPNAAAYPGLLPALARYDFPTAALGAPMRADDRDRRVQALGRDLDVIAGGGDGGDTLRYIVPWGPDSIAPNSVDLVFSQAALQEMPHREAGGALRETIEATARWLRPGGLASHQVDFGCYGMTPWNLHWTWSTLTWKIVRGRRENFVNREPLSTYLSLMAACGLTVVAVLPAENPGANADALAPRFRALPEAERRTCAAHIIARKDG
jgi:hypothetical protein